jgi:hypothetical protein
MVLGDDSLAIFPRWVAKNFFDSRTCCALLGVGWYLVIHLVAVD